LTPDGVVRRRDDTKKAHAFNAVLLQLPSSLKDNNVLVVGAHKNNGERKKDKRVK
jgi:hypothetical protein